MLKKKNVFIINGRYSDSYLTFGGTIKIWLKIIAGGFSVSVYGSVSEFVLWLLDYYFQVGIQGIESSQRIAINKMTRLSPLHVKYAFLKRECSPQYNSYITNRR